MKRAGRITAMAGALMLSFSSMAQAQEPTTIIIMDGSGSMWGRIDGRPKLEIARDTLGKVLAGVAPSRRVGLMAYGHRTRGDCSDIELLVPPAAGAAGAIRKAADSMRFQGKTPLTDAMRRAAQELESVKGPVSVVLVTDGIETCDADPCAVAQELKSSRANFTAHVIGFGLTRAEGARLACIAKNTGGRYMEARDAGSLSGALASTVTSAPPPVAPPPPAREKPMHFPGAELMTDNALSPTGRAIADAPQSPAEKPFPAEGTIAQCKAICDADKLCGSWRYEPKGSLFVDHARCFVFTPATEFSNAMVRPDEGWASGMKKGVIGLTRPYMALGKSTWPVRLEVRGPVAAGAPFTVLWEGPANDGDWIDVVAVGESDLSVDAPRFLVNETIEAGDALEGAGALIAPEKPGRYELRYVLGRDLDQRVLFRVPITVGGR